MTLCCRVGSWVFIFLESIDLPPGGSRIFQFGWVGLVTLRLRIVCFILKILVNVTVELQSASAFICIQM